MAARRRHGGHAVKIVVTGPFAAGKTTLIRTISEITVLSTDRSISDDDKDRKPQTTVAMDFGRISIDPDLVLYLFGTPGQERFDFMWEILGEGMLGYVLLIDVEDPDTLVDAARILDTFRGFARVPFVVALNRAFRHDQALDHRVRNALSLGPEIPVVPCDATAKDSVKEVLLALLYAALEELEAEAAHA
ncbi:MAG: ATP/GTP-binding protein [Candidatus Nanopelagicales bacterium]